MAKEKDEEKVTRKPPSAEKEMAAQPLGGPMGGDLGYRFQFGGFGNPMGFTPPEPRPIFGASAQQSSQDFARLQMPERPSIPLDNAIPVFPDNYNQVMGEKMRAPSWFMANSQDRRVLGDVSGFSPYSPTVPSMGGLTQTPSMAPVTDNITSFSSPLASRTERIDSPYGTGSTTLTPEQQAARAQARQQAQEMGTMPRAPEEQQALLAQMREKGAAIGKRIADTALRGGRTQSTVYTTPKGDAITAPSNMFGQTIPAWKSIYEESSARNRANLASRRTGGATDGTATTPPSSFWQTISNALPSITTPTQYSAPTQPSSGLFLEPQIPFLTSSQEMDPFGGLRTAIGSPRSRRSPLPPFGMREARS